MVSEASVTMVTVQGYMEEQLTMLHSRVQKNLDHCFPNAFARGPLLASKINYGSSHPCSRYYRGSG
jgi:hypothetical protein